METLHFQYVGFQLTQAISTQLADGGIEGGSYGGRFYFWVEQN